MLTALMIVSRIVLVIGVELLFMMNAFQKVPQMVYAVVITALVRTAPAHQMVMPI